MKYRDVLEVMMLSGRSQAPKTTGNIQKRQIHDDEVSGCLGLTAEAYKVSFGGDQRVCDSIVETAAQLQERFKAAGPCHLNR